MKLSILSVVCGVLLLCAPVFSDDANAIRPSGCPDIWQQADDHGQRADMALDRLEQKDPNLAQHLRQLRGTDPEKFRNEFRAVMREHARGPMMGSGPEDGMAPMSPGGPDGQHRGKGGNIKERLEERHNAYVSWLEKNYPEEAAQLASIKEKQPDQYFHRLKESLEKYGRIAMAEKEGNTALAKVFRDDLDLKLQIDKVLEQLRTTKDDAQKKTKISELTPLVAKRFDLIVQQKELRYQNLNKKLEDMKKELATQEAELGKLKSRKSQEVHKHVEELVNKTEELKWD